MNSLVCERAQMFCNDLETGIIQVHMPDRRVAIGRGVGGCDTRCEEVKARQRLTHNCSGSTPYMSPCSTV